MLRSLTVFLMSSQILLSSNLSASFINLQPENWQKHYDTAADSLDRNDVTTESLIRSIEGVSRER